jgi:hypothetical protein
MVSYPTKVISNLIIIFFITLIFSSCDRRPKGVLNQDDMTIILTDFHRLDGILYEKGIAFNNDSLKAKYYNYILNKHQITKAEFDSSLVWYTKHPKKFEKIYDDIYSQLSLEDNQIKRGKYHPIDSAELAKIKVNIWNLRSSYNYKNDSIRTRLKFEIKDSSLLFGDAYILKFLQRIAHQDSCLNRRVVLRINYANGKSDSVFTKSYNDSLLRRYSIKLPASKKWKIKSISGELLACKAFKGKFNASIDSISLIRVYNPKLKDSLLKIVKQNDPRHFVKLSKIKGDSIRDKKIKISRKLFLKK